MTTDSGSTQLDMFEQTDSVEPSSPQLSQHDLPHATSTLTPTTPFTKTIPKPIAPQDALAHDHNAAQPDPDHPADILKNYTLIRSRRRTLSLSVAAGKLKVRAPMRAPKYWIEQTIAEKQQWIVQQFQQQQRQKREILSIQHGREFDINGQQHSVCFCQLEENCCLKPPLKLNARNRTGKLIIENKVLHLVFAQTDGTIQSTTDTVHSVEDSDSLEANANRLFVNWVKKHAEDLLASRVEHLASQLKISAQLKQLRFRVTKTSWGHCTSDGIVQLNPYIALTPVWVRDYVIIHELCHLTHPNHSKRFWRLVEKHCTYWKDAEKWLDEQGHTVAVGQFL